MPQLHFYVPEDIAHRVRERAKACNMSVSRYLAEMVTREVGETWPEGYFDRVCGRWEGPFPPPIREHAERLDSVL